MAKIKLGSFDIQKLLSNYEANLRQLQFQMEQTKKMIKDLKSALPAIQQAEASEMAAMVESESMIETVAAPAPAKKVAKGKRGRPAGSKAAKKTTAKPKTKKAVAKAAPVVKTDSPKKAKATAKKATAKKNRSEGYKLSEYDLLVFQALEENGKAMITSDLQTAIEGIKAAKGGKVDTAEVSKMIIRSLQKLANRRSDIKKVAYSGRGMAYALPAWVNNRGAIKPAHKRKDS